MEHIGKVQGSNFTQQRGFDWLGGIDSELIYAGWQIRLLLMPTIIGSVSFAHHASSWKGEAI